MFGDGHWIPDYHQAQNRKYNQWLSEISRQMRIAIVELGAGTAIPTVRSESEKVARDFAQPMIRINPREYSGPDPCISISGGGLKSLREIEDALKLV